MPLRNGRTTAYLQTILVGSVIPPGVIEPFGGGVVPDGWLLCDGSLVSRSTYAGLFAVIGIVNGEGDASTTFALPDLRGRFLRGSDDMGTGAAGRDPDAATRTAPAAGGATGDTVGSVQDDAMQGHAHAWNGNVFSVHNDWVASNNYYMRCSGGGATAPGLSGVQIAGPRELSNGAPKNADESRPQNANVNYIIKV